tara:strand:- start:1666 stop:1767 length:102 start_codon:yes stop_codon:yes gene_type:complete
LVKEIKPHKHILDKDSFCEICGVEIDVFGGEVK